MRFRAYDSWARLALVGSVAAAVSFALPWASVRGGLLVLDFSGFDLALAPAYVTRYGPVGWDGFAVGLGAGIALIASLSSLLLALDPGLRVGSVLSNRSGRLLALAGLLTGLVALLLMWLVVGPRIGPTSPSYGAVVGLAGLALATAAWPRARMLDEEPREAAPEPPGASSGPR